MWKQIAGATLATATVVLTYQGYKKYQTYRLDYPVSQYGLVELLYRQKKMITHDRIANAMKSIDRKYFLPSSAKDIYFDLPQPIGFNATLSAPHMAACMLDFLNDHIKEGSRVLDIGSGSGFITACASRLVGKTGLVVGVDHIQELVTQSMDNIKRCDSSLLANIQLHCGDGFQGWKESGPYDCIYVGAASEKVPDELVNQLKLGGRMVIPVGPSESFHQLLLVDKALDGTIHIKSCGIVRFVPLTTKERQLNPRNMANSTKVLTFDDDKNSKYLVRAHMIPAPDSNDYIKEYETMFNEKVIHVDSQSKSI